MKCTKCGSLLTPDAKFCTKCGQPVNVSSNNTQSLKEPNNPHAPKVLKPSAPKVSMPSRPLPPQQPSAEDKGFLSRIGHGISAAATGRSFSQGYDQQRTREHTFEELSHMVPVVIADARKSLKDLQEAHPGVITDSDELDITGIIKKLEELIAVPEAREGEKNSAIKKALNELDDKLYELRVKCDPSLARQESTINDEARLRDRNVPIVQLHDVNEDELAIVRNKAIWGIQPGQIARRVTERELDTVEGLNGFIIRDGCQAMIFVNGQFIDCFDEGAYNVQQRSEETLKAEFKRLFDEFDREEKEKLEAEKQRENNRSFAERGGVNGMIGRGIHNVARFIFGATPAKKKNEKSEAERIKDIEKKVEDALKAKTRGTLLSIILVRKGFINMTFGGYYDGDTVQYQPYTIPTRLFDVKVGVSLRLKVSNIWLLAENYLADRNSLTTNDLFRILDPSIEGVLAETIRNIDYAQEGLSVETREILKQNIQVLINNRLQGFECHEVERITDRNEDFDRFRQVERDLYCSEKELDFMQRTGEMRNRMEQEQNRQLIDAASNKEDYAYALQKIDIDHLYHQDEYDDHVRLFEAQRIIKQATSDKEVYEALEDLKKNRLVKDDEVAALEDALERGRIDRSQITDIMRIQANESILLADMKSRFALEDYDQNHEWERADLERKRNWGIEDEQREREWVIEQREYDRARGRLKAEDDYDFEKMMRQRAVDIEDEERQRPYARQDKFDEDQLEANAHARQMQSLEAAMKLQMQQELQEQQHEQAMANISSNEQINRDNNFLKMSAEQIRATQLSHLSPEAQVAMANSYSPDKMNELLKEQAAKEETRRVSDMDRMERMFNQMGQNMMGVSQNMMNAQQQRTEEFHQDALRQQERLDKTTEAAMRVSTAAAGNIGAFNGGFTGQKPLTDSSAPAQPQVAPEAQPQMIECECYNCKKIIQIPEGAAFCPECGAPFEW